MLHSKFDIGEQLPDELANKPELRRSKTITALLVGFLFRLNPANWFNEFRNIEITIEEDSIKKD